MPEPEPTPNPRAKLGALLRAGRMASRAALLESEAETTQTVETPLEETVAKKSASSVKQIADAKPKGARRTVKKRRQRFPLETRAEMLDRLTNPTISLHETSVILQVCSASVRRFCENGLPYELTDGGHRRFRLRDVLQFERERKASGKHKIRKSAAPTGMSTRGRL